MLSLKPAKLQRLNDGCTAGRTGGGLEYYKNYYYILNLALKNDGIINGGMGDSKTRHAPFYSKLMAPGFYIDFKEMGVGTNKDTHIHPRHEQKGPLPLDKARIYKDIMHHSNGGCWQHCALAPVSTVRRDFAHGFTLWLLANWVATTKKSSKEV